jgi:myo-inositol-1(or 4)-monophosphatase
MCLVASGAADAYFYFGINIWDIAAGCLIAEEAGCVVCDPIDGKQLDLRSRRVMVASTDALAHQLISLIEEVKI